MEFNENLEEQELGEHINELIGAVASLYENTPEAFSVLYEFVEKLRTSLPPLNEETTDELSHALAFIEMNKTMQIDEKNYFAKVHEYASQIKNKRVRITTFLNNLLEEEKEMYEKRKQCGTERKTSLLKHHLEVLSSQETVTSGELNPLLPEPSVKLDQHLTQLIQTDCREKLAQITASEKAN